MRVVLSSLLILEACLTAYGTAVAIPKLAGYDAIAVTMIVARAAIGALQLVSGVVLASRRAPAVTLARGALVASAVLTTFAVGFQLAPTDVYPWFRWHLVVAYWVYVVIALVILVRSAD